MRRMWREAVVDGCNGEDVGRVMRRGWIEEARERSDNGGGGLNGVAEGTTVYVASDVSSEFRLRGQGLDEHQPKSGG